MFSIWKSTLSGIAVCLCNAATAEVISLTFDELPHGTYYSNLETEGFRISPHCHVDIFTSSGDSSKRMGYDTSGCGSDGYNDDYLGANPAGERVHIDLFGDAFDLLQFTVVSGSNNATVRSSKGGLFAIPTTFGFAPTTHFVTGSLWQGIEWIELAGSCFGTPCIQFDELQVKTISEPTSFAVAVLGLLGLFRFRRAGGADAYGVRK